MTQTNQEQLPENERLERIRKRCGTVWIGLMQEDVEYLLSIIAKSPRASSVPAGQGEAATCEFCEHTNPHDGPAGTVNDACTHPCCNCAFYSPRPASPPAEAGRCAGCGHSAKRDLLGGCMHVERDAGGSLVYCHHRCTFTRPAQEEAAHVPACCVNKPVADKHGVCGAWCFYCITCSRPHTGSLNVSFRAATPTPDAIHRAAEILAQTDLPTLLGDRIERIEEIIREELARQNPPSTDRKAV